MSPLEPNVSASKGLLSKLRYQTRMLKHRPKLLWDRLWLRQDEFHSSLNLNATALLDMSREDRKKYVMDLVKRRNRAHQRDC